MPEIKFKSEWLKAKVNVDQFDNIRFIDAGKQDADGQWIFTVGIVPQGETDVREQKKFQLNKVNFVSIKEEYGSNSDDWVGNEMVVNIVQVQNPRGETVDGIRLTAPQKADIED